MEVNAKRGVTSRGWFIVLLLYLFFPLGLFFMWKNKVFLKGVRIVITLFIALLFISVITVGDKVDESTNTDSETNIEETEEKDTNTKEAKEKKKEYDSKFKNDFAALVDEVGAEIFDDLSLVTADDGSCSVVTGILIKNNEKTVDKFLDSLKTLISSSDECQSALITFGDISEGKDGETLLIASIQNDEIEKSMISPNFNSLHNQWIQSQFSVWDGSHTALKDLIKKRLNDEDSFKHIQTRYREINTDEDVKEVNNILSGAGKTTTVQKGDLFIVTEFSAKNGFNATIKSRAYGVASYENNSIILVSIE